VNTVSWGEINAVRSTSKLPEELREAIRSPEGTIWLQTDAVLDHGSSGGPLLDASGKAVGMSTFIMGPQLGFALHLEHARGAFQESKTAKAMTLPFPPGEHESAMAWYCREVGSIVQALTQEIQNQNAALAQLPESERNERLSQMVDGSRSKLRALYQGDPKSWQGLQALLVATSLNNKDRSPAALECQTEVCQLVLKHHAHREDLYSMLWELDPNASDEVRQFGEQLLSDSPHREVQLQAAAWLAMNRLSWLGSNKPLELDAIQRARSEVTQYAKQCAESAEDATFRGLPMKDFSVAVIGQLSASPVGIAAPETAGVDVQGKKFTLADYRGQVVLLDFFADWCPWCRRMYDFERRLAEKMKGQSFALLGVNCDNQKTLGDLVGRGVVTWQCWADGERGPIAEQWKVEGFPTLYLIDRNGVVRRRFSYTDDESAVQSAIETLLKEKPDAT
jgi:peroxiredoxin